MAALQDLLLAPLLMIPALAISDAATSVIDQLSTVATAIQVNQKAIDGYQGGLVAAATVGMRNYDTWSTLRATNSDLQLGDGLLGDQDSEAIFHQLSELSQSTIGLMKAYQQKEPLMRQARVNFVVPIVMQALYMEADTLRMTIARSASSKYTSSYEDMRTEFTTAWGTAFDAYTTNLPSNSAATPAYGAMFRLIQPFFKYFAAY